jgi:hypothetical protein
VDSQEYSGREVLGITEQSETCVGRERERSFRSIHESSGLLHGTLTSRPPTESSAKQDESYKETEDEAHSVTGTPRSSRLDQERAHGNQGAQESSEQLIHCEEQRRKDRVQRSRQYDEREQAR